MEPEGSVGQGAPVTKAAVAPLRAGRPGQQPRAPREPLSTSMLGPLAPLGIVKGAGTQPPMGWPDRRVTK